MASRTLEIVAEVKDKASSALNNIAGGVNKVGMIAGGAALAGVVGLGIGLAKAGGAGLTMNNQMEQAAATINAFTKDARKTADILKMVEKEAASTPFAFKDMATAAAALIPSANAAGEGLEKIIKDAEILAASNPAQGLEGAAFALKEAVSGDFTSIIERFNLPRQYINKLKEEGVPNLEIVRRAMGEMGLDIDLVSSLAGTAEGRWSTFLDTLTSIAATVTKPIFDVFSAGLGKVNEFLAPLMDNFKINFIPIVERMELVWNRFTAGVGEKLGPAIDKVQMALSRISIALGLSGQKVDMTKLIVDTFRNVLLTVVDAIEWTGNAATQLADFIDDVRFAVQPTIDYFREWSSHLSETTGPAMMLIEDALKRMAVVFGDANKEIDWSSVLLNTTKAVLNAVTTAIKLFAIEMQGAAWSVEKISEAISIAKGLTNQLGTIFTAMGRSIKDAVNGAIGKIKSLANAIRDAAGSIPPWLIPGSPTPFEIGLRGIAKAAGSVAQVLPNAFETTSLPQGGSGKSSGTVIVEFKPMVSTADKIELERNLIPMIREALRG